MKKIQLTPYISFTVPADWPEVSKTDGSVRLRTSDGGTLFAQARELRKPPDPRAGLGPTSEQMVSVEVSEFGVSASQIAHGRAFATHPVLIGEPGKEKECRAWHIVNQVRAWHYETVLLTYEPAVGRELDQSIIRIVDKEIRGFQFNRVLPAGSSGTPETQRDPKPWWKIW